MKLRREPAPTRPAMELDVAKKLLEQMRDPIQPSPWCSHCGGWHLRACPRVKRLVFKGTEVTEVEFWETWDDSCVYWQDEVAQVVADAENEEAN